MTDPTRTVITLGPETFAALDRGIDKLAAGMSNGFAGIIPDRPDCDVCKVRPATREYASQAGPFQTTGALAVHFDICDRDECETDADFL